MGNEDNVLTMKIGRVTVRDGLLIIADPHDIRDGVSYDAVMSAIVGGENGGEVKGTGGVAFLTGQADGKYPVIADINEEGRIISVTIDFLAEPQPELPVVTPEHFGALNLLAHHYDVLGGLIAEYSAAELDDLVKNGYRTN